MVFGKPMEEQQMVQQAIEMVSQVDPHWWVPLGVAVIAAAGGIVAAWLKLRK
jgi:hypothetical protein